jgi:uncharacterized coiled-coil protein SlyX
MNELLSRLAAAEERLAALEKAMAGMVQVLDAHQQALMKAENVCRQLAEKVAGREMPPSQRVSVN